MATKAAAGAMGGARKQCTSHHRWWRNCQSWLQHATCIHEPCTCSKMIPGLLGRIARMLSRRTFCSLLPRSLMHGYRCSQQSGRHTCGQIQRPLSRNSTPSSKCSRTHRTDTSHRWYWPMCSSCSQWSPSTRQCDTCKCLVLRWWLLNHS